jgi:hypothetical protein
MPPPRATTPTKAIVPRPQGIAINTTQELIDFANMVYRAGPPVGHNKPESIAYAIAFGLELGIRPAVALSLIKVVGGKPSADGEAALSLIKSSPMCESLEHGVTGDGDSRLGWIETKRRGETAVRRTTFSVADAKRAITFHGKAEVPLWGSSAVWRGYPDRMLVWRAIGHHAKDWWADVMCGLAMVDDFATAVGAVSEAEVVSVQTNVPTATAIATQGTTTATAPVTPALPDKPTQAATATTQSTATQPISEYQKSQFARYRNDFLKARNVDLGNDAAVRSAWADFLASWGVRSAIDMTSVQAEEALTIIYDKCHPPEAKAMFGDRGPDGGAAGPVGNG